MSHSPRRTCPAARKYGGTGLGLTISRQYAADLAEQMGIELSRVSVVDGKLLGCRDSNLLQLYSGDNMESALNFQQELGDLQNGVRHPRLETRIRAALSRLKMLSEA